MLTTAFWLVVLFPLLLAFSYAAVYGLSFILLGRRGPDVVETFDSTIYLLALAVPLFFVLRERGSWAALGIVWPEVGEWPPFAAVFVSVCGGAVIGFLLYRHEIFTARLAKRWFESRRPSLYPILEGGTQKVVSQQQQLPAVVTLLFGGIVVAIEELLWRGFLIEFLSHTLSLSPLRVVLTAGLLFGLNHYYFGIRNVLLKSLSGIVWGGLYLLTGGSLLAPLVSHLVFDWLALELSISLEFERGEADELESHTL